MDHFFEYGNGYKELKKLFFMRKKSYRDSKIEEISKNVRMVLSSITDKDLQESLVETEKYFIFSRKKIKDSIIKAIFLLLSIFLGIAIAKEEYFIFCLIFAILFLIFCLQIIFQEMNEKKFKKSKDFKNLIKLKEYNEKIMNKLIN